MVRCVLLGYIKSNGRGTGIKMSGAAARTGRGRNQKNKKYIKNRKERDYYKIITKLAGFIFIKDIE